MSFAEIESELETLSPAELRRLALKSWTAFVEKEARTGAVAQCSENDPDHLAALDEAVSKAQATPGQGCSGNEVRTRLNRWTSK